MSNFNKEERVAFEQLLEGFDDALVLSKMVKKYETDQQMMERTSDTIWRPQPYIVRAFTNGLDQTSNFQTVTQLAVPATIGYTASSPWTMKSNEFRDMLQEGRISDAARQRLASQINTDLNNVASLTGTLVVKRTAAASGFDDVAQCDAIMNEQGVPMGDRYIGFSTRDYNSAAGNLASRTLGASPKTLTAYEKAYIGEVGGFSAFKMDYTPRLAAAAGVTVTLNGANQYYTPKATSTASTGEVSNVDNRYQNITIAVTSGTVKVGDSFTVAGVNAVHHITKQDTGQLKTFRITAIVSGAGGSGVVTISPPIISGGGSTTAELQYQNVSATPANGAAVTFLNTVAAAQNPFWHADALELLPGRIPVDPQSGLSVMRGTTESGLEVVMSKWTDINTLDVKLRVDTRYGIVNKQPEMTGVILFSQT